MSCKKLITCENIDLLQQIIDETNDSPMSFELEHLSSFFSFCLRMINWSELDQEAVYHRLLHDINYYENGYLHLEKKYSYEAVNKIFIQVKSVIDKDAMIMTLDYILSTYNEQT